MSSKPEVNSTEQTKEPTRTDMADAISSSPTGPTLRRTFFKNSLATIAAIVGIGGASSSAAAKDVKYREPADHDAIEDSLEEWDQELNEILSRKETVPGIRDVSDLHRYIHDQDPEIIEYEEYKEGTEFLVFTISGAKGNAEFGLGRNGNEFYYSPENLEDGIKSRNRLNEIGGSRGNKHNEDNGELSSVDDDSIQLLSLQSDCDPRCEDYPNSCGPDCDYHQCCVSYGDEEDVCTVYNGACGSWDSVVTICCYDCHTAYDLRIDCCGGHTWCPDSGCPSPHPDNC